MTQIIYQGKVSRTMVSSFLRFLDHTQRHITVGRTPLDEWSARRRDLYLTTHNTHNRQHIRAPGGIRTHDPSRRAAGDRRLRPRGHWERRCNNSMIYNNTTRLFAHKNKKVMSNIFLKNQSKLTLIYLVLLKIISQNLASCSTSLQLIDIHKYTGQVMTSNLSWHIWLR